MNKAKRTATARREQKQSFFAVRAADGRRSSYYRVSVPNGGSDVYVLAPGLHGYKASIHASGECYTGFDEKYARLLKRLKTFDGTRQLQRWKLSETEQAPGIFLPLRIFIPEEELRHLSPHPKEVDKPIEWIEAAPRGGGTAVDIVITEPSAKVFAWPFYEESSVYLHSFALGDGRKAWLIYRQVPVSIETMMAKRYCHEHGDEFVKLDWGPKWNPGNPNGRLSLFGQHDDRRWRLWTEVTAA